MPYGPLNCLAMFISFIHDVDSSWKELASSHSVHIGKDINNNIIINNILSWAKSLMTAIVYMECQPVSELIFELEVIAHLPQTIRVCWDWCLPWGQPSSHVQTPTPSALAFAIYCAQRCKICGAHEVLFMFHSKFWGQNHSSSWDIAGGLHHTIWQHVDLWG